MLEIVPSDGSGGDAALRALEAELTAQPRDWRAEYHAMVDQLVNLAKIEGVAVLRALESLGRDEELWVTALKAGRERAHQQAQVEAVMQGLRDLHDERVAK